MTVPHQSFLGVGADRDRRSTLDDRREAIAELGEALRTVIEQTTDTEAPAAALRECAALLQAATTPLSPHARGRAAMPSADDLVAGIRMYNPVTGAGSALAPPLRIELIDGVAVGTCTLGPAYEGPPTYVHGGISALLLDQMLGYAASAAGRPGLTAALDIRYRAPVPLHAPLRLEARVIETGGRSSTVTGEIATADNPHTLLVRATATFVTLRPEQLTELFGQALHPDTIGPFAAQL